MMLALHGIQEEGTFLSWLSKSLTLTGCPATRPWCQDVQIAGVPPGQVFPWK